MLTKVSGAIVIGILGLATYVYLAYFSLPALWSWPYLASLAPQVGALVLTICCIISTRLLFRSEASRKFKIYTAAVFVFFSLFACSQEAYIKLSAFTAWLKPDVTLEELWLAFLLPFGVCALAVLLCCLHLFVALAIEDDEDRERVGGTRGILKFIGLGLTVPIATFWVSAALIMNAYYFEGHQIDWFVVVGCVVAILISAVISQENYLRWDKAVFSTETSESANLPD